MKQSFFVTALLIVGGLILGACVPVVPLVNLGEQPTPDASPVPQPTTREAQVQSVQIQAMDTDPLQINAVVRGNLTQACATLGQSQVQYGSNAFQITIYEVSPGDRGCAQVTTPFETTIALNTNGFPAGAYTVTANGVSAVFTLPAQTATTVPTATPVPVIQGCIDSAKFISDVTIPDNTILEPGTAFTKTWRLKNTGSCTWDSSYLVSYMSGTTMSQQPAYRIVAPGRTVAPGQALNISVGMTAPMADGNYQAYWGLQQEIGVENGPLMPIQGGANGNSFFVKIRVRDGNHTPPGKITDASIDIVLEQGSGAACTPESTYFVTAQITADGPTTAYYEIGSTAGQIPAGLFQTSYDAPLVPYVTGTVVFDRADTKRIPLHFVGPYPLPGDITVNLRVNDGPWHNTKLACP
jgi:Ig-like domain-containing protein